MLMSVHGPLVSLETCSHFSWFRVLIKHVLVCLQLITLKIKSKENFSVCYCRISLSNKPFHMRMLCEGVCMGLLELGCEH